jgi:hypothetical protein
MQQGAEVIRKVPLLECEAGITEGLKKKIPEK